MSDSRSPIAPKVKGSKQEDLILVPHRPIQKAVTQVLLIAAYFAIAAASFYVGQWLALKEQEDARVERDKLQQQVQLLSDTLMTMEEEKVFYEQGQEVEKRAIELLRKENKELLDRISELEEATAHYQRVLTPDKEDKGLVIGRMELKPTAEPQRYRYHFNLIQVSGGARVEGVARIKVHGLTAGEKRSLPLQELSTDVDGQGVKLGFRNYQSITGEMVLPEGFIPEQIDIEAEFTGRKAVRLRKIYDWTIQETVSDVGQG